MIIVSHCHQCPHECALRTVTVQVPNKFAMALLLSIGAFLGIWLLSQIIWIRKSRTNDIDQKLSDPPSIPTYFPYIGHILGIIFKGSNIYISELW